MEQELIVIEDLDPGKLFTGEGLDELLETVSTQAKTLVINIDTARGRKDLASFAHKIAKSKTALDLLGKNHVDAAKKELKKFDANRKKAKDFLTDLQVEVRKPLTEWEAAEEKRVQDIADRIKAIQEMVPTDQSFVNERNLPILSKRLKQLTKMKIGEDFEEMAQVASAAKAESLDALTAIVLRLEKEIEDQKELLKLRAESQAQQQKDRETEVARQATEKAQADAAAITQKALDDKVAAEKREVEAVAAAKQETEDAAQAERDKIAAERLQAEEEVRKRTLDTRHKGEAHSQILAALLKHCSKSGLTEKAAKKVIAAMAGKVIPRVTINY